MSRATHHGPRCRKGLARRVRLASTGASLALHLLLIGALLITARRGPEHPPLDAGLVLELPDLATCDPPSDTDQLALVESLDAPAPLPTLESPTLDSQPDVLAFPVVPDATDADVEPQAPIDDLALSPTALRLRVCAPRTPPSDEPVPTPAPPEVHTSTASTSPPRPPPRLTAPSRSARRGASGAPLRIVRLPDVRDYYPARARRQGAAGTVLVEVVVSGSGRVTDARVVRSSGHTELDAAGVRLARAVLFARGGGGRRRAHLPVVFDLR